MKIKCIKILPQAIKINPFHLKFQLAINKQEYKLWILVNLFQIKILKIFTKLTKLLNNLTYFKKLALKVIQETLTNKSKNLDNHRINLILIYTKLTNPTPKLKILSYCHKSPNIKQINYNTCSQMIRIKLINQNPKRIKQPFRELILLNKDKIMLKNMSKRLLSRMKN